MCCAHRKLWLLCISPCHRTLVSVLRRVPNAPISKQAIRPGQWVLWCTRNLDCYSRPILIICLHYLQVFWFLSSDISIAQKIRRQFVRHRLDVMHQLMISNLSLLKHYRVNWVNRFPPERLVRGEMGGDSFIIYGPSPVFYLCCSETFPTIQISAMTS